MKKGSTKVRLNISIDKGMADLADKLAATPEYRSRSHVIDVAISKLAGGLKGSKKRQR